MINGAPYTASPSAGGHADHPDLCQARAMPSRLAQHAERRKCALTLLPVATVNKRQLAAAAGKGRPIRRGAAPGRNGSRAGSVPAGYLTFKAHGGSW
jgi:hypothetical protein